MRLRPNDDSSFKKALETELALKKPTSDISRLIKQKSFL